MTQYTNKKQMLFAKDFNQYDYLNDHPKSTYSPKKSKD